MKKILLDTNFILTCIRQKIDFFEELKLKGMQILIPKQVINEIKNISTSKKKLHFREEADLSLKLLQRNFYKEIEIRGSYVDKGIIQYAKQHPKVIVATLDKELKENISNPKLVIRGKNKLELL